MLCRNWAILYSHHQNGMWGVAPSKLVAGMQRDANMYAEALAAATTKEDAAATALEADAAGAEAAAGTRALRLQAARVDEQVSD